MVEKSLCNVYIHKMNYPASLGRSGDILLFYIREITISVLKKTRTLFVYCPMIYSFLLGILIVYQILLKYIIYPNQLLQTR